MNFPSNRSRMAIALALSVSAVGAQAATKLCVFDIVGATGDAYNMAKDYALAMQKEGVSLELKAYTNEAQATEDFRAGQCDGLMATAFRTRAFNGVAASIDTLGATTVIQNGKIDMAASYDVVRKVVQTFASPQAASLMSAGGVEVGGIFPFGAAYPMVKDRSINTVEALAGKKIAAFDHDKAQSLMIQRIKAQPVSADISNFATQFNAGSVDMIAAPTLAYKPLELGKGLGTKGGIARFPLMILTYQVVFNQSKIPGGFGEKSRGYWAGQFDRAMALINNADAGIPGNAWIELTPEQARQYNTMLQESRLAILAQGVYNPQGLKVIKKVRCSVSPGEADCKASNEEG